MICNECKTKKSNRWVMKRDKKWYCGEHAGSGGGVGIFDANGVRRDRAWLNKKLAITKNERTWHKDIKSRRAMPDGSVRRVNEQGKIIG